MQQFMMPVPQQQVYAPNWQTMRQPSQPYVVQNPQAAYFQQQQQAYFQFYQAQAQQQAQAPPPQPPGPSQQY